MKSAIPSTGSWIDAVKFDEQGLVTAIAQEVFTNRVLMVAWMNRAALLETAQTKRAVYWSRSRGKLWRKGEESGNTQTVRELRLDCDGDVVLLKIDQIGGIACHTGRNACFFNKLEGLGEHAEAAQWSVAEPVLVDPNTLYK
jgi:phosphoribosyl-AMP cyclohydrolase